MKNGCFKTLLRAFLLRKYYVSKAIYSSHSRQALIDQFCAERAITFDLSDNEFIHLGDTLFFGIIGILLQAKNISVRVKVNQSNSALLQIAFPTLAVYTENSANGITIGSPYMIFDARNYPGFLGLGGVQWVEYKQYPLALLNNIEFFLSVGTTQQVDYTQSILKIRENLLACGTRGVKRSAWEYHPPHESNKYLIVSPYLGSGRFRDLLKRKRQSILRFARKLLRQDPNLTPVLVGSKTDPFVYIAANQLDLRGRPFNDVLSLVCSEKVTNGIGFDNFWFHVFQILGKKYYCKFRGRFSKKSEKIHFAMVNRSFCWTIEDVVEYI